MVCLVVQDWRTNQCDVEGERLEERNSVLTLHFLENHSEFVLGDFVDEVALELDDNAVASEQGAESVPLVSKEAEAVALEDEWVVETSLG